MKFLAISLIFLPVLCSAKDFGTEGIVFPISENHYVTEEDSDCDRGSRMPECRVERRFTVVPTRPFPKKLERWLRHPDDGLLFLRGCDREHIKWVYSQEGEFSRVIVKGCQYECGDWMRHRIYIDYDHALCKAFGIKNIPCRVTPLEEGFLVEEIPVRKAALSVCISFSMPEEIILSLSRELEHYGGSFKLQAISNDSVGELGEKIEHLREMGVNARFVIDPEIFEVFDIREVPTLVITGPKGVDKMAGDISIQDFLEKASLSGENRQFAAKKLETPPPKYE